MRKLVLLIIVSLIGNFFLSAQENNEDTGDSKDDEYVLFIPSHELESKIKNRLHVIYMLIKLRTHPKMSLDSSEYNFYSTLLDTLQTFNNVLVKDSNYIILKNGLAWKLNGDPPAKPKNFYIKAMTRKGRKDSAVVDRLKYLQFCHQWRESDELPRYMVDKFVMYQRIEIDKVVYFESSYEFEFNVDKRLRISKKEIKINRDVLRYSR